MNGWMQTYTGVAFWPASPKINDIKIEDIAHALSMICRYTGHTKRFYSVAEHSIIMSRMVPPRYKLEALLHDASEAYLNDIAKPLKVQLKSYLRYENQLDKMIRRAYSLPSKMSKEVKVADGRMLATERSQLIRDNLEKGYAWDLQDIAPYDVEIVGMNPLEAKNVFLGKFRDLWIEWDDASDKYVLP